MSKEYNIGIYIRLSMADEDTGYGSKAESDSIGNQRMSRWFGCYKTGQRKARSRGVPIRKHCWV